MDTYTVKIDFQQGGGWQDISSYLDVNKSKIPVVRNRSIYNDLKITTNTVNFRIKATAASYTTFATLVQNILTNGKYILVWIQKNGSNYFTGLIRPNFSVSIAPQKIQKLDIECVDYWYYVATTQAVSAIGYFGYAVSNPANKGQSILHQLMYSIGFADGNLNLPTISTTIAAFSMNQNDSFQDAIQELCFEYGYALYFDASGILQGYDLAPSSVASALTLQDNNNILATTDTPTFIRQENKYDAIDITYNEALTKTGAVIFNDTTGATGSLNCSIPIANAQYYPKNASATIDGYCDYAIQDYTLLAATNIHALNLQFTGSVYNLDTWSPGPTKAAIKLTSSGGGVITTLQIIGDAIVQGDQHVMSYENVAGTQKREAITAKYIYDDATAKRLGSLRASYFANGKYHYEIDTTDFTIYPGEYVTLSEGISGISQLCRVISVKDGDSIEYQKIVCEGFAGITISNPTTSTVISGVPAAIDPTIIPISTILNNVVTPPEFIQGFVDVPTGATKTPTVPTISQCVGAFKAIAVAWDIQSNLTNFDHFELQVSGDSGTTWYSLKNDGTDYKDTLNAVTSCTGTIYTHILPSNASNPATPTGYTLTYRVRRVTKIGDMSSYSATATATSLVVQGSDIVANTIYAALQYVNNLFFTGSIGTMPNANPQQGDRRAYFKSDGTFYGEYYDGANWNQLFSLGGNAAQILANSIGGPTPTLIDGGSPGTAGYGNAYNGGDPSTNGQTIVGAMYPSAQAIGLIGDLYAQNHIAYDFSIRGKDTSNRSYDLGRYGGLKITDANGMQIHDTPNAPFTTDNFPMGHLYSNKYLQTNYLLYSGSGAGMLNTWNNGYSIVTDGITNIKGVRLQVYFQVQGTADYHIINAFYARPNGTSWTYAVGAQTPSFGAGIWLTANYVNQFVVQGWLDVPVIGGKFDFYPYSNFSNPNAVLDITQIGIWV
jgi:hypothetical protein